MKIINHKSALALHTRAVHHSSPVISHLQAHLYFSLAALCEEDKRKKKREINKEKKGLKMSSPLVQ